MEAGAAGGQAGGGGAATAAPGAGEADAQQQQQGQQQEAQQQQQPGIDPGLLEQLGTLPEQFEQMRQFMEQSQLPGDQQQQDQTAAEQEQVDLSFVDPTSPTYNPQQAAEQLLQVLQAQNAQAVQEAVAPLQQQLSDVQNAREADALASEFPDLQNPETADAVFKATSEWVQAAGLPPEAAGNMQVVRAVYMMGRAAELHNEEQGQEGQQDAATLEGAGGASPAGTGQGMTAESILGTQRRSPLPFG